MCMIWYIGNYDYHADMVDIIDDNVLITTWINMLLTVTIKAIMIKIL